MSSTEWTVEFTDAERGEIVRAATVAAANGATVASLCADDFELPTIRHRVGEWSEMLHTGRGFVLLRRFPVDLLDEATTELAYIGLGLHLGTPVGQNAQGDILGHVRDERLDQSGPGVRLYRTRKRQDFHTDGADLVGLLCLHRAASGGEREFHVEMDFQPGDIQLLNNAKILHAREAYEDHDNLAHRRHLLRLWLAAHHFASVEGSLRGGIRRRS